MGFFWGYDRKVHLQLLLLLIGLFCIDWAFIYAVYGETPLEHEPGWVIVAAIFTALWVLRGMQITAPFFPWFHYSILLLELGVHLVKFVLQVVFLALAVTTSGFFNARLFVLFIYFVYVLIALTYLLLLLKCALDSILN